METIEARRILITCQSEGREPFTKEVERLFKSLNIYGGKLANAQKVACFTEPIDATLEKNLASLGVKTKIIENLYPNHVYANKIEMLRLDYEEDFDLLVALDTDIVIANDFSDLIDETRIGAPIEDVDPLGIENWKNLFQHFGLKLPSTRYFTYYTMTETIPYFNSAVLLIPRIYISKLYETWKSFVFKFIKACEELPEIAKHLFYANQFALALAIQHEKLPFYPLPLEMNFSTHIGSHKDCKPEKLKPYLIQYRDCVSKLKPYLIHYHHRVTKSSLMRHCYYDNINETIDTINLSLSNLSKDSMNSVPNIKQLENTKSDDPEMLVDELYMEILKRPADKGALQHFSSMLERGKMTLDEVRKQLLNSDEYKAFLSSDEMALGYDNISEQRLEHLAIGEEARTIVDELYVEILRRPADPKGLEYYGSLLESGKLTTSQVRKQLLNSDEYKALLGSDEMTNHP